MNIYDPIANALNITPVNIKFPTLQECIELGIIKPWKNKNDIVPWNKGISTPSSRKGKKFGKQKFPKKTLSEEHKEKLKGPNPKLKKYSANRSVKHTENIKKAAIKETKCKYCSKVAAQISIARWHNENCKHKPD